MEKDGTGKTPWKKSLKPLISTIIIAAAVLGGSLILSKLLVRVQKERVIYAKGVADKRIASDFAVLHLTLKVRDKDLAQGGKKLLAQKQIVIDKLKEYGFDPSEMESDAVRHCEVNRLENGKQTNFLEYYDISQTITLKTKKVDLVEKNCAGLSDLLLSGINISVSDPDYFISDQEKHKLELIEIAGRSATARAAMLAEKAGAKVGRLLSARVGIVQISDPNSSEISDYGVYDLSCKVKNMRIVVTMEFAVK